MPDADVLRLWKTYATFVAGSKQRQFGVARDTKQLLIHGETTDTMFMEISDDSKQLLLATTQNATGVKTFSGGIIADGVEYRSTGDLTLNADYDNDAASSKIVLKIDDSEKARLTNAGRLGVGGTSPDEIIHAVGGNIKVDNTYKLVLGDRGELKATAADIELTNTAASGDIQIQNNATGDVRIKAQCGALTAQCAEGVLTLKTVSAHNVVIGTNNTTAITVDTNQKTTFDAEATIISNDGLNIQPDNSGDNTAISFKNDSGDDRYIINYDTTNVVAKLVRNSGEIAWAADTNANVGIGTTTPDYDTISSAIDKALSVSGGSGKPGIEVVRATNTDGDTVGVYKFINSENANASAATSRVTAMITSQLETTDSNADDDSGGDMSFWVKPEASGMVLGMAIDPNGVGIGTSSPDGKLHIYSGDSGLVAASTGQLTLENNGDVLFQLLSPAANSIQINLGDADDPDVAYIRKAHSGGNLTIYDSHSGGDIVISHMGDGSDITLQTNCGDINLDPSANIVISDGVNIALDTTTGTQLGTTTLQKFAVYGNTAVIQQSSTGQTAGFTAGSGTAVNDDSTFTGGSGSTAYTIGDIVKHFKTYGWLAL